MYSSSRTVPAQGGLFLPRTKQLLQLQLRPHQFLTIRFGYINEVIQFTITHGTQPNLCTYRITAQNHKVRECKEDRGMPFKTGASYNQSVGLS